MIKIIAILNNSSGSGGGVEQALNAVIQMQRLSCNRFNFEVFVTQKESAIFLNKLNIKTNLIKIGVVDKFLAKFSQNPFWQSLQLRIKIIGPLERKLIKHECDLVYFVSPGNFCSALQKLNYINTIWDLCHREMPEFPEVRNFNNFFIRENNCRNNYGLAYINITDSESLSDLASKYYGVERSRFLAMPFSPTPYFSEELAVKEADILALYNLKKDYFYYPAQFWAHKNHIRILQSLVILRNLYQWTPHVVFSGKDYGNLTYIKRFIKDNQLEPQVSILGFIPGEHLQLLYKNSQAIVMPTYFGPTNLPPLEAFLSGKPLIYSSHLSEQVGDAALLIDPDNAIDLANAMRECIKPEVSKKLIKAGFKRLERISFKRNTAEKDLCMLLKKFSARRETWK